MTRSRRDWKDITFSGYTNKLDPAKFFKILKLGKVSLKPKEKQTLRYQCCTKCVIKITKLHYNKELYIQIYKHTMISALTFVAPNSRQQNLHLQNIQYVFFQRLYGCKFKVVRENTVRPAIFGTEIWVCYSSYMFLYIRTQNSKY